MSRMLKLCGMLQDEEVKNASWLPEHRLMAAVLERAVEDAMHPEQLAFWAQEIERNWKKRISKRKKYEAIVREYLANRDTTIKEWAYLNGLREPELRYAIKVVRAGSLRERPYPPADEWILSNSLAEFSFLWIVEHLFEYPKTVAQKIREHIKALTSV